MSVHKHTKKNLVNNPYVQSASGLSSINGKIVNVAK